MYYNDSDQARESGLRRAFVESMQELMKCVNTLAAGAAEKAYCYLNLCGMDVFTGCFFVDRDGRASLSSALLGKKQGIFETVMTTQARKLRGAYIEYADDIPGSSSLTSISVPRSRIALPGATNTRSTMRRCCISIHGRANTARTRRRSRLPI